MLLLEYPGEQNAGNKANLFFVVLVVMLVVALVVMLSLPLVMVLVIFGLRKKNARGSND